MKKNLVLLAFACAVFTSVLAQDDLTLKLSKGFKAFRESYSPVKLLLTFNQPAYVSGDTAFFCAFYLNADGNTLMSGKEVGHFLLVNEKGEIVAHEKNSLLNGIGNHYMVIPGPDKGKHFRMIAYTTWMMNVNKDYYFEKDLVVNGVSGSADKKDQIVITPAESGDVTNISVRGTSPGTDYVLAISSYRSLLYATTFSDTEGGRAAVAVQKKYLTGDVTVSILTADGKRISEVAYNGQGGDNRVEIEKSKGIYTTREGVKTTIRVSDSNGLAVKSKMAIRVFNESLFAAEPKASSESNTHWINWEKVFGATPVTSVLQRERNLMLSGKVTMQDGSPVPDSTMLIFFFEKNLIGYHQYVSRNGEFNVPLVYGFKGTDRVLYTARYKNKDMTDIKVTLQEEVLPDLRLVNGTSPKEPINRYASYASQNKLISESYTFYGDKPQQLSIDPNFPIEDELGGVDIVLDIHDFVVFPTMAEVIRELLRAVEYRKIGNRELIRVYKLRSKPVTGAEPIYVIDGRLTKDKSEFLKLVPADVVYIKVVRDERKLRQLGPLFDNGAIMVKTKNGTGESVDEQANSFVLKGLAPVAERKWQTKASHIPDFKAQLYWNPLMETNDQGEVTFDFTTSDDIGNFKIEVNGLGDNGKFIHSEDSFRVEFLKAN
jgi:hypothetical protein